MADQWEYHKYQKDDFIWDNGKKVLEVSVFVDTMFSIALGLTKAFVENQSFEIIQGNQEIFRSFTILNRALEQVVHGCTNKRQVSVEGQST